MYSILLVDDEKLELETLKDHFDWGSFGISVVGTAKNGRDALEKVKKLRPNIVLTDVKMPIMNGLDFARQAKELIPDLNIAFLSGYDEFQFVKSAMDIDATGYLLKPIDYNELRNLMNKIKKHCEQRHLTHQSFDILLEKTFKEFIFTKTESIKSLLIDEIKHLMLLSFGTYFEVFGIALITIDDFSLFSKTHSEQQTESLHINIYQNLVSFLHEKYPESIVINITENRLCIVINNTSDDLQSFFSLISYQTQSTFDVTLTIIIENLPCKLSNLHNVYNKLSHQMDYKFYIGKGRALLSDEIPIFYAKKYPSLPSIEVDLLKALYENNRNESLHLVNKYYHLFMNKKVARSDVISSTLTLLNKLSEMLSKLNISLDIFNENKLWDEITHFETLEDIRILVLHIVSSILDQIQEKNNDPNQQIVNKILSILETSYNEPITVKEIASKVYLSPNYISTLFKEKTNQTIMEYLKTVRIEKATELLKDSSLKIHEISSLIGYENTSYFCSLFHKYKGITPNEYRKTIL